MDNRNTIESVVQEVAKAAKNEKKGKPFKTNLEIADGLQLTLEQVYGILSAKKSAEDLKIDGFVLAGNIRLFDDGSFGKGYTKAGQLMVEAIEEATKQMGCPFDISGEYMIGRNWGECH